MGDYSFKFSLASTQARQGDVELKVTALHERIARIIERCTLDDFPIMAQLLKMSANPEEIDRLGRGLVRVAPLVGEMEELRAKKKMFDMATSNPEELAWMFGDVDDAFADLVRKETEEDGEEDT